MSGPGGPPPSEPWWASGQDPDDGLDGSQDPLGAHREARRGDDEDPAGDPAGSAGDGARLATEAMELIGRLAAEAGRRVAARSAGNARGAATGSFTRPDTDPGDPGAPGDGAAEGWRQAFDGLGPHEDGQVCDACPFCIGLRAIRQVRPEVIGHLSDAAHHLSLALRAFADAQAGGEDLEKIDLDQ